MANRERKAVEEVGARASTWRGPSRMPGRSCSSPRDESAVFLRLFETVHVPGAVWKKAVAPGIHRSSDASFQFRGNVPSRLL